MIHIFDNIFSDSELDQVQVWAEAMSQDDEWFETSELEYAAQLVELAGNYFDLSSMIGCEMHINYDSPDPHKDKDEEAWFTHKQMIHPLCSIVYYPRIESLQGGNLLFPEQGIVVAPKTNRAVVFRSDLLHSGTPCAGVRQSIGINPWDKKPLAHIMRA